MYEMTFESPPIRTHTSRSYLKIQELFAQFGGLFTRLTILIRVLITNYVNFKYHQYIVEIVFDNARLEKNNKENIKIRRHQAEIENIINSH